VLNAMRLSRGSDDRRGRHWSLERRAEVA